MSRKGAYKVPREYIPFGIGARIDDFCYENDMSYKELARKCKFSHKTLYALIGGDVRCRADTLIKLSKVMNMSLDYLVFGEEK